MSAKTPQRTLFWARRCIFISREHDRLCGLKKGSQEYRDLAASLREYASAAKATAAAEGYDDTATYIQHILDDLGPAA